MQNNLVLQDNIQKLFDKGSFVLFRWNNDELWSIEYVSQNVSNLLGYSSEEFLEGKITYAECIHPDFLDQVQKEVAAESKNQSDFFEHKPYKIITNTQQEKWVLVQTLIEKDAQGNITGFVGYINDITSTMELKDENELLQQRVQLAVESTNDGIWDWDLINNEVYFSVQWKKMLGYSDKEIENKAESFFELIHPDEKENTQKTLEQHLQKRTPYVVELRLLCKDGSYKWILSRGKAIFDAQGKPIRILGSHVDISHQKEIERKLQESEFRWKFAIEGSGDGLWDWNLETDEVFFSTQWKKMLGFEEDEIKGSLKEWQKRVHPDHLQTVYKDIQNYLDGKTQKYANEHQVLCKDGSHKWILDRGIIVTRTQDGTPTRMIGTHTDVNTHRKLLIKLQDAQKTVLHEKNFVETIIESANAVVAIIDSEGRMIKLNRYGQNFTGYTEEEISQEPYKWSCLLPQNIREKVLSIIENAKKGNILKSYQNKWISKNGESRMFEWSNTLVKKEDGSMDYMSSIGIDITQNEKQKVFLQLLINSQSNMMALADNNELTYVNQAVLDFYDLDTLEEMKQTHKYFCNTFIETDYSFSMKGTFKSEDWILEILKLPAEKRIVSIFSTKLQVIKVFRVNIEHSDDVNSYLLTFLDISETVLKQQELEYKSNHDPLTKAYNREYFYEHYHSTIAYYAQMKKLLGVALIDIDHFKDVNDTYGHNVGDEILQSLVRTIWENTRESDTLIRWGGEEFILLMPTKDRESLNKILDTLRQKIQNSAMPTVKNITVSIGASIYDTKTGIEETIKNSDTALYKAKNSGRNRLVIL